MLSRRTFLRFSSSAAFGVGVANLLAACAPAAPPPAPAPTAAATAVPKVAATVAPTTAPAAAATMDKIKFQLRWVKNIQFGGFFAGLDKGFYKDEGLDVEILGGGPNISVLQVVTGGGANIGYGVFDDLVRARAEQGLPVTVFGANYQTPPVCFMSKADNPVKTAQDFVGKKLATTNGSRPTFEALMTHNGVDPGKVNVIPAGVEPTAMATGEVDVYHGFSTQPGLDARTTRHQAELSVLPGPGFSDV
jgi:ABC-type nitrate/sulfonate/bicarbonate transport system substrate-binding protein